MCFGKPDENQGAAPANPMPHDHSVAAPHHPPQGPPEVNPLCYHAGQMIDFIMNAGQPL